MTEAVAVFNTRLVKGEVVFTQKKSGVEIQATFTHLKGIHGFHIHKAGDLRGEGCKNACDHYHVPLNTEFKNSPLGSSFNLDT